MTQHKRSNSSRLYFGIVIDKHRNSRMIPALKNRGVDERLIPACSLISFNILSPEEQGRCPIALTTSRRISGRKAMAAVPARRDA